MKAGQHGRSRPARRSRTNPVQFCNKNEEKQCHGEEGGGGSANQRPVRGVPLLEALRAPPETQLHPVRPSKTQVGPVGPRLHGLQLMPKQITAEKASGWRRPSFDQWESSRGGLRKCSVCMNLSAEAASRGRCRIQDSVFSWKNTKQLFFFCFFALWCVCVCVCPQCGAVSYSLRSGRSRLCSPQ